MNISNPFLYDISQQLSETDHLLTKFVQSNETWQKFLTQPTQALIETGLLKSDKIDSEKNDKIIKKDTREYLKGNQQVWTRLQTLMNLSNQYLEKFFKDN